MDFYPVTVTAPSICSPYLPYVILAFRPLYEAGIAGMAVLAVVSIDFGPLGRAVHGLGSFAFFYGILALSGCFVHFQASVTRIWPVKARDLLGLDAASSHFRFHKHLFYAKVLIIFGVDWCLSIALLTFGAVTGGWAPWKFYSDYIVAISQWAMVVLIALTAGVFARDIDAMPLETLAAAIGDVGQGERTVPRSPDPARLPTARVTSHYSPSSV